MAKSRIFEFKDDKIYKLVEEKAEIIKKGRDIANTIEELQKELNLLEVKVQKTKEKIIPLIVKKTKPELKEFEMYTSSDIKDGMVTVTIVNELEIFMENYKKQNKK